ncbi:MAG: hypothetical protein AB7E96_02525 [Deferribacterales bacterium]
MQISETGSLNTITGSSFTHQQTPKGIAEKAADEYISGMFSTPETYNSSGTFGPDITTSMISADNALDNFKEIFGTEETTAENDNSESAAEIRDKILNSAAGTDSSFMASDRDDSMLVEDVSGVTINTKEGDDKIFLNDADGVALNMGDGDDQISMNDTVKNASANMGDGDDTVNIYGAEGVVVSGDTGSDTINVESGEDVYISGGAGNDIINVTQATNLSIDGGDGDDQIILKAGQYGTISGGSGSDVITGAGNISGGTGDDFISLERAFSTETYSMVQTRVTYNKGDGHDIVTGADENTTIVMNGMSSDDVEIKEEVGESGKREKVISMKDGSGSIRVRGGSGAKLEFTDGTVTL